jgi:hypothetical protein
MVESFSMSLISSRELEFVAGAFGLCLGLNLSLILSLSLSSRQGACGGLRWGAAQPTVILSVWTASLCHFCKLQEHTVHRFASKSSLAAKQDAPDHTSSISLGSVLQNGQAVSWGSCIPL